MGGSTRTVSGVPSDVQGLRQGLVRGLQDYTMPNYQPNYAQNAMFRPSVLSRRQAMNPSEWLTPSLAAPSPGSRAGTGSIRGGNFLQSLLSAAGGDFGLPSFSRGTGGGFGGGDGGFGLTGGLEGPAGAGGAGMGATGGPGGQAVRSQGQGLPSYAGTPLDRWERGVNRPDLGYIVTRDGITYDSATGQRIDSREIDRRLALGPQGWAGLNAGNQRNIQNILPQLVGGPPPTSISDLPGLDVASMRAAGIELPSDWQEILNQIRGSAGESLRGGGFTGGFGGISAPAIGSVRDMTQSADVIAGADSPFARRILDTYNRMFGQQRELALAQAKEAAGNLTGSGYAAALGNVTNRSLAEQQTRSADVLNQLVGREMERQMGTAGLEQTRNIEQARLGLQASLGSQGLELQAKQLAQQAIASGRQDLMGIAQIMYQRAQRQAELEQQSRLTNVGAENAANLAFFGAGVGRNQRQAELDQERLLEQFRGAISQSGQGAENLLRMLLGLSTTGVGPDQVIQSGGWGQILGPLAGLLGTYLGGRGRGGGQGGPTRRSPTEYTF